MRVLRPIGSLLIALLVGGAMFAVCYWTASCARLAAGSRQTNELAWLGREFHLTDAEIARVRALHQAYLPKCEEMCTRIAVKNRQLAEVLKGASDINPEIERMLAEVGALRAECQAQMLRHFQEIARTMPIAPGRRYLAKMQSLTLGLPVQSEDATTKPIHEHP